MHIRIVVPAPPGPARDPGSAAAAAGPLAPLADDAGSVSAPAVNAAPDLPDWGRHLLDDPDDNRTNEAEAPAADDELDRVLRYIADMPTWSKGDVVLVRNHLLGALRNHAHR